MAPVHTEPGDEELRAFVGAMLSNLDRLLANAIRERAREADRTFSGEATRVR